jgi:hypothetical protein
MYGGKVAYVPQSKFVLLLKFVGNIKTVRICKFSFMISLSYFEVCYWQYGNCHEGMQSSFMISLLL